MTAREWITRPAAERTHLEAQGWRFHGFSTGRSPQNAPLPLVIMWRPMPAEDAGAA